jgi:uncharacterized protein (TIGR01777 family)
MAAPRRILVTGASGLVGGRLVGVLLDDGFEVRATTRRPDRVRFPAGVLPVGWDGTDLAEHELAGCAALVHLAGEPVFAFPMNAARRERILASRVDSTRALVRALARISPADRPRVLVCASAVGYYGDRGEEELPEGVPPGSGFLADVCVAWEAEAAAAAASSVRVVCLRIGIVLAREGGALAALARVFRVGLGGRIGRGRQWVPWIHVDDLVGMIRSAVSDERWQGAVNAVAPNPVRNHELTRTLARVVRRPALLPVPALPLRLALGDLAGELLGSRKVIPARARELGYRFAHETLEGALRAELGWESGGGPR